MNKVFLIFVFTLFIFSTGCDLQPDTDSLLSSNGIVIYSGREILNDREIFIVTNRVQRLQATAPAGHIIEWTSDKPEIIEINNFGVIRTSRTPNQDVVIRAVSAVDPAIQAQVTFKTKGLR